MANSMEPSVRLEHLADVRDFPGRADCSNANQAPGDQIGFRPSKARKAGAVVPLLLKLP
jgi:hypothetical protein